MIFVAAGFPSPSAETVRREYLSESSSRILSFSFSAFFFVFRELTVLMIKISSTRITSRAPAAIARQSQYFWKKPCLPKLTLATAAANNSESASVTSAPVRCTERLMLLPPYTVLARQPLTPLTLVSKLSHVTSLPASSIRQAVYSG